MDRFRTDRYSRRYTLSEQRVSCVYWIKALHTRYLATCLCVAVLSGCTIEEDPATELPVLPAQDQPGTPTPPDITDIPDNGEQDTPDGTPVLPDDAPEQTPIDPALPVIDPSAPVFEGELFPEEDSDITETLSVYQTDGYEQIDVVRVDVETIRLAGPCIAGSYDGCTLADVEGDTDRQDDFKPRIDVHFSATDFPDDGLTSNAEFRQRGGSTRQAEQKSFRIRLDDKDNLWRGERSLYLNKHPFEATRIRNKLAFDLMAGIPHMLSSRTQFVNLWINDGAKGPVDFGLFTHVESPGGNYLEKRGRSRDDRLYKTNLFRFKIDDMQNVRVDADGAPLDEDLFESSLEIESGDDHRPLAKMMRDFHDPERSFDSILDQYFNRNNILSWMAVNFLLNQNDAISQNFILYNPVDTELFYFLPWDYDGALSLEEEPPTGTSNENLQARLFAGYARGSKSDFYSRYYRQPGMHLRMVEAASFIRENYLTDERINDLVEASVTAVTPFASRAPDIEFNPGYNRFVAAEIPEQVAGNLEALSTRFSYPVPPELLEPVLEDNEWVVQWREGIDPTGNELSYEVQVSTGLAFTPAQVVLQFDNIDTTSVVADAPIDSIRDTFGIMEQRINALDLLEGEYFVRVIARSSRDPDRFWQVSENILSRDGTDWRGPVVLTNP